MTKSVNRQQRNNVLECICYTEQFYLFFIGGNKMVKKAIQPWLIFLLCVSFVVSINGFAETEISESVIVEMQSFDIVRGDENGELHLDDAITRAEFSAMMVRTLKMQDWIYTEHVFSDVKESDWYYEDVMRLTMVGIIAGFTDGTFRPDDFITADEASKMIVTALGYGSEAERMGGYPGGYSAMANKLHIFYDVNVSAEKLTRSDVIMMLYNSLDISLLEPKYADKDSLVISKNTLRDLHIYNGDKSVFIKKEGYVTATPKTWLITPYPDLKDNEVVIDGTVIDANGYDAEQYLGMQVTYYVSGDNETRSYTLRGIVPTADNFVAEFDERDYAGKTGNEISVYEGDKLRTYRTDDFCILVKNMRPVTSPTDADYDLKRGNVRLMDNDGDHVIDYIFMDEFESVLIDRTTDNEIWLDHATPYRKRIYFDLFKNPDVTYFIEDKDGNTLKSEDLPDGALVSILSDGESVYRIIAGQDEAITGIVTELGGSDNERYIAIGDNRYRLEPGMEFDVQLRDEVVCKLNFRGEAAHVEKTALSDGAYGYVLNTAKDGFHSKVKLLVPGIFKAQVKTEEGDDEDDVTETQILKGANSDVITLQLADRVRVDDQRLSGDEAMRIMAANPIVKYYVNDKQEINKIETPEITGSDLMGSAQQRKYNGYEQIFGGIGAGAFAVTEKTSVLCLPDHDGVTNDQDYLAAVEILDGSKYVVNGYDKDDKDEAAGLIVIQVPLRYNTAAGLEEDAPAVLEDIVTHLDDEGDSVNTLIYWQDGVQKSIDADMECDVSALKPGDVFLAALGATSENVLQVQKIVSLDGIQPGTTSTGSGSASLLGGNVIAGYPMDMMYNKVDDVNNRRVDIVTLGLDSDCLQQRSIAINVRNAPDIYVYDARRGTVSAADTKIIPLCGEKTADADMVVVYEKYLKVKLVVIVTQ